MKQLTFLAVALLTTAVIADDPTAAEIEFFESKIRPLLAKRCFECHSSKSKEVKAELRLDSHLAITKGGESGPVIVPGKPDESALIQAVRFQSVEMPPKGKLPDTEIEALTKWVAMGAPWPPESATSDSAVAKVYDWAMLRREHWAWKPVARPTLPRVNDSSWPRSAIDFFVLARLEATGLRPAPRADKRTLVRRAYFDLTGLPPQPREVAAFLADTRPDAFARLVDQLLQSPAYGEHWGRHWLDVARYSDGLGGFLDNAKLPHAWRYRDWVITAMNDDLPYDDFVRQQIAGDTLGAAAGTGFFGIGPTYRSDGGDPDSVAQAKSETLDDRVDTFSRGFLALTVSCARCHDHKFDPIPTQDYYSLAGIFNNTKINAASDVGHVLQDSGGGDMKVALRGDLRKQGEVAPRRFLRILSGPDPPRFSKGSGRIELAEAVVRADNPLTARVMVNRIWLGHFGKALVRSPSNFGKLGQRPTHPQLLDWLAGELMRSSENELAWSLKRLHRTIMLSATYQMSSRFDQRNYDIDADNRLVWRMNPRRLNVEAWRDALLAATGDLHRKFGGAPTEKLLSSHRRTVYAAISRNRDRFESDEFLRLFDLPAPRVTSAKRTSSVVPQQYLFMMNSTFMIARAKSLAARLNDEANDDSQRIDRAYELLYARSPRDEERQLALAFLEAPQDDGTSKSGLTRWEQLAQVLLSANEFMYFQ